MIVVDIFTIKNRGTAVIFDPNDESNKKLFPSIKLNQTVQRVSDGQEWTIAGIDMDIEPLGAF